MTIRKIAIFSLLAFALLAGAILASPGDAASSDLVAAYSFDEGSGSTVGDASGHGNTGTIAAATWTSAGKHGSALSFGASGSRVSIPSTPALQLTTGATLEAWVYPTSVSAVYRDVVYKGDDDYYLEGTSYGGSAAPVAAGRIGTAKPHAFGASALPLNTWSYLAMTYDGSKVSLYVNGNLAATQAASGSFATSTYPLEIGGDSIYGQSFTGKIDDVRVYRAGLSQSEIVTDMQTAVGAPASSDTSAPSTPTGLSTSGVSATQATLSWAASTDNVGVTGYRVFRNGTQIGTSTTTSYTFSGLTCGTTSTLGVAAVDAAGNVSPTATKAVATGGCSDTTPPAAPTALATTSVGQTSVGLSWNASTDNVAVTGYRLFQNGAQVGTSTTTGYLYGGLTCGTSYSLGVAAVDGSGNVSPTVTKSVTTAACSVVSAPSGGAVSVSTSGNDSTCVRGDSTRPCLTLNKAFSLASCGDTVSVAPGNYGDQTITGSKSCTASTPVKFVASSGQPVFSNVNVRASYVWIEGMKVPHSLTGTTVGSWNVAASSPSAPSAVSYVTLKNDEGGRFYIYAEHVDMLGGSYGGFNSCLTGGEDLGNIWQQADGSGTYRASSYITLDGVTVHDATDNGNLCSGHSNSGAHVDALQILGGHHITIRNSFFYNCPTSCIIGSGFRTGEDNYLIENNFFQQESHPGATLNFSYSSAGDPPTGANMVIRYNTTNGSIATGCVSGSAGCWKVYGNIAGSATCGPGSTWSYNVIMNGQCVGGTNKKGTPSFVGPILQGVFGSTTIPNFHLSPTDTVAKNAGDPANYPATDRDGNARPQGAAPDAGADEVG